jgi:hypothetical protein
MPMIRVTAAGFGTIRSARSLPRISDWSVLNSRLRSVWTM